MREDQQLLLSRAPGAQAPEDTDTSSREIHEAGSLALYNETLKGMVVQGEKLVVFSDTYVGVSQTPSPSRKSDR